MEMFDCFYNNPRVFYFNLVEEIDDIP